MFKIDVETSQKAKKKTYQQQFIYDSHVSIVFSKGHVLLVQLLHLSKFYINQSSQTFNMMKDLQLLVYTSLELLLRFFVINFLMHWSSTKQTITILKFVITFSLELHWKTMIEFTKHHFLGIVTKVYKSYTI